MARRTNFPRSGARPNRNWSTTSATSYTSVGTSAKVLIGGFTPTAAVDLTILRTVGIISVGSDQAVAVEDQVGAFGMITVSDDAFAAGAASIPGPVTDAGNDGWFMYQSFAQRTANALTQRNSVEYQFDSRAKRIIPGTGITIALMVENASPSFVMEVAVNLRLLAQVRGTR